MFNKPHTLEPVDDIEGYIKGFKQSVASASRFRPYENERKHLYVMFDKFEVRSDSWDAEGKHRSETTHYSGRDLNEAIKTTTTYADEEMPMTPLPRRGSLLQEGRNLWKVSEHYGSAFTAQLVFPPPPRTTVRHFKIDDLEGFKEPTKGMMKKYDAAYMR
jgi:hypothetical protein